MYIIPYWDTTEKQASVAAFHTAMTAFGDQHSVVIGTAGGSVVKCNADAWVPAPPGSEGDIESGEISDTQHAGNFVCVELYDENAELPCTSQSGSEISCYTGKRMLVFLVCAEFHGASEHTLLIVVTPCLLPSESMPRLVKPPRQTRTNVR